MYDANGKQRWITGYPDKAKTRQLMLRLEDEKNKIQNGDLDPQHELRKIERAKSIKDHLSQYKVSLRAAGRDKNHVAYTIKDIENFIDSSATTHAASITRPMVDGWKLGMIQAGTDANRTINRRVGSLQAFLKWLQGQGVITEYVLHKFPKLKTSGSDAKRQRRALSDDEVTRLLSKAPSDRVDVYRFSLLSGARYSAVVDLKVADVDLATGTMKLKRKTKGGAATYTVPIHPTLTPILKTLIAGKRRENAVFDVMRRENAAKMVKADCKLAGVDEKHVDFHALRHTFCTNLALANVHPKIAMELAGHSSLEMTLNYYTHFQSADKLQALAMLK